MNEALIDALARCLPWIKAAVAEAGDYTLREVLEALLKGEARLWSGEAACVVTADETWADGPVLLGWLAAGDGAECQRLMEVAELDAAERGCVAAVIKGRRGWERRLKASGYRPVAVVLRKELR